MEVFEETVRVLTRFKSESGEVTSGLLELPVDVTSDKLQLICNALLKQVFLFLTNSNKEICKLAYLVSLYF